jgi:hypothetical protein
MRQYGEESFEDQANVDRQPKLPQQQPSLPKYGEVKRSFDFLITTPGKLRRGVARHGDALRGFTDYNLKLFRGDDRRWALYLEWVDLDGEGHRLVLPHEVVAGVLQRANSIIAECRRERAQRGVLTRGLTLREKPKRKTVKRKPRQRSEAKS